VIKIKWLLLVLICTFFFFNTSYALILKLYKEIGVNTVNVKIKDIGVLIAEKTDIINPFYKETVLFSLPQKPITYSSRALSALLAKKIQVPIRIIGKKITFYPLYTIILTQEITEKIKTAFHENYPQIPTSIMDPLYLQTPHVPKMPAGGLDIRVIVPGGNIGLIKYARLEIKQENLLLYTFSFPIKMMFHVPSFVAKKNLSKRKRVELKDFKVKIINIFTDPRAYILSKNEIKNKRLTSPLKKGMTLLKQNLQ
jgi:hypothetical protein